MPDILLSKKDGTLKVPSSEGETLLAALGRAGVSVSAPCGGKHRCGKCRVKITEGKVKDTSPGEPFPESLPPDQVLACRSIPVTDVTVTLISDDVYEGGLYQESFSEPGKTVSRAAAALDLGTTTISARLIDLDTGSELGTYSALNRQRVFGADVMSRIGAAREGKTSELFEIIRLQTAEMLSGFMEKFNLASIEKLIVAGNTTMLHLFVNEDPSSMGEIPFIPLFLDDREYNGGALNLPVEKIFLFPSISAFIGGDVVSGLIAIDVFAEDKTVFFIDIGTNGEMALFHKGKLFCTSAAAGPALEGAEISCGTGSVLGAINKVEWINGQVEWSVIGNDKNKNPAGICGCGLIDAIAVMLEQEIIDETGSFNNDEEEFAIAPGITIIGRDVRQYQLAKSAILSAIKILIKNAGLALDEVEKVFVAGGLGFYIDQNSAIRSGLLPSEFRDKIEVCGNTSLKGAVNALLKPNLAEYAKKIKDVSIVTELASDSAFMDEFAENMIFPDQ